MTKHIFNIRTLLLLVTLFFAFTNNPIKAQGTTATAVFDSVSILLGDQINFTLTVEQFKDAKVTFPVFNDSIVDKIEVISQLKRDTVRFANDRIRVVQKYIVTGFDSGVYKVGPLKFIINEPNSIDTITSEPTFLGVNTFKIEDPKKIADIKGVIEIPLTFAEILPYILIGLGVLAIIALIAYIIIRIKQKKPIFGMLEKPAEPPHVTAFRELEHIKSEKLWQQGQYKQFHTRVTDVVRSYIEGRFAVPALESTSDEIIFLLKDIEIVDSKTCSKLKQTLELADFVKFAKAEPLPNENEESWQTAYDFVAKTYQKPEVVDSQSTKESLETE